MKMPSRKARDLIMDALDGSPYEDGKIRPGVRALHEYVAKLEQVTCDGACHPEVKPSGKRHELKTWPAYFKAIERGQKKFELRENDRNFGVGDLLILREWDPRTGNYTGRESRQWVTYVIDDVFATVTKFGPSPHDRLAVLSLEGAVVLDPLSIPPADVKKVCRLCTAPFAEHREDQRCYRGGPHHDWVEG